MLSLVKRDDEGDLPKEEIIMFYHEEFKNALIAMGFTRPIPSLLDMNVELLKHGKYAAMITICIYPILMVQNREIILDDMVGENSRGSKKALFENPICKRMLQREMKIWEQKGFF